MSDSISVQKVVALIPARLAATRLPNKPLADIGGKPMIQHVYERTKLARCVSDVFIATPDPEIFAATQRFGGKAIMTSAAHPTGTDRLAEAARTLPDTVEIIVNVQGDEPLIDPDTIDGVVAPLLADASLMMSSASCPLPEESWGDAARVKVVCDRRGNALYFSRSPIPYRREANAPVVPRLHLGLYAYRRDFLLIYAALPPTPLEQTEALEQLRALENGYRIRIVETDHVPTAIDTPDDLARVRALFQHGETA